MNSSKLELSVLVPAYGRVDYLPRLLQSIIDQTSPPHELIIVEDKSQQRMQIREVVERYIPILRSCGISVIYSENEVNLGYDANLRRLLELASGDYAIFLGNDDELLPNCVTVVREAIAASGAHFLSRAFRQHVILPGTAKREVGLIEPSRVPLSGNITDWGHLFGLCSVITGLVFHVRNAQAASASQFDGGLYYQYHLTIACNLEGGTWYIPTPIVSCRADLAPEFGDAGVEKVFTPGRYTAASRIKMASSVLEIYRFHRPSGKVCRDICDEFNVRQSIHIFEMMSSSSRSESFAMWLGFWRLGLFRHPLPVALLLFNIVCGESGRPAFLASKRFAKRVILKIGLRGLVRNTTIKGNS